MARALENPDSKPSYLDYFGMTRPPFDQLPGPSPIFLSDQYSLLTRHLTSVTEQTDCLMVICGADGSGKTTLLNRYITSLNDDVSFAAFDDTCKDGTGFYTGFLRQLGFRDITGSLRELRRITKEFLIHRGKAGDPVLVIVDNAHLICASVYEQLRWIAETRVDDRRVLSIVLAGNTDLHRIMDSPAMSSIKFRSHIDFNIRVYTEEETEDYVRHRLRLAGGIDAAKFANAARPLIYRYSGGVPSAINLLCNEVLTEAYTRETRVISADLVRMVADTHNIEPTVPVPQTLARRKTDPDIDLQPTEQPEARITAREAPANNATGTPEQDTGLPGVDVAALLARVGELSEQLADVEEARNHALSEISIRDKDVHKLHKQLATLLKKTAEQEIDADENAAKVRQLKSELSDTTKALRASEKNAEKAIRNSEQPKLKVKELQLQVDRLTDQVVAFEVAGKQAQSEIRAREKDVKDLQKCLDRQTIKAEKQQQTAEEKTDQVRQLKRELSDTAKALRSSEQAVKRATLDAGRPDAKVEALLLQIDELADQLASIKAAEKQVQSDISARDEELAGLRKQLDARTASLEATEKQAQLDISARDEELAGLRKQLDAKTASLEAAEKQVQLDISARDEELAELRKQLDAQMASLEAAEKQAQRDISARDEELAELQNQLDAQTASVETAEKQAQRDISARDEELAELQNQLDAQAKANEKQKLSAEKHADEILQLRESLSENKAALRNRKKHATVLAADLKKEERATRHANSELASLKIKIEKLEDSKKELQASIGTLNKDLKEANKRVNKSHVVEKSNESLKKKIETKTEQLSARDKALTELEKTLRKSQEECDLLRSSTESQKALAASVDEKDALILELETELAAANSRLTVKEGATERPADAINAFEVIKDGKVEQVFPIGTDESRIMIGRSDDSELCLDSKFVSRHHALVFVTDHRIYIEDLNSFNGVAVNSKAITRAELHVNDTVVVGDFVIRPRRA